MKIQNKKFETNSKLKILASVTLSAILFLTATPVFAAQEYKVYSSEAIGAGEKVYHIESCLKTPSYGPLYCSEATKSVAPQQCESKDGKLQNVPIKGCETSDFVDAAKIYPKYDPAKYHLKAAARGCADEPVKQGFFYAPEFAIVDAQKNIKGTVIHMDKDSIPRNVISAAGGTAVEPLYRPTLCTKLDVLAKNNIPDEPAAELTGQVLDLFNNAKVGGINLIKEGCNNDNTSQSFGTGAGTVEQSTPFNNKPTYTCTIYERITGASGSDLLGKYISALYRWAAGIVGIVAVLTMTYSGIQISMAGGDTAKLDSAKNRIMQSIIGLVILFLSGLILYTINPGFFTG